MRPVQLIIDFKWLVKACDMRASPGQSSRRICLCGHPYISHRHYRSGSECSQCLDCPRYRSASGPIRRIIDKLPDPRRWPPNSRSLAVLMAHDCEVLRRIWEQITIAWPRRTAPRPEWRPTAGSGGYHPRCHTAAASQAASRPGRSGCTHRPRRLGAARRLAS